MSGTAQGNDDAGSVVKFDDFKLSWLHTFACVWKLGGYSNAAKYLNLSQSTVTRQVAALEKWFGRDLLTKNRPPRITPSGEKVYGLASSMLYEVCGYGDRIGRAVRGEALSQQEKECLHPLRILQRRPYTAG